jgi:Mrp family chromosome partitioning ATPase
VVGLVLGLGLAFLLEYLDRRIKDEQTMEKLFGVPVLATVPLVSGRWGERRKGRSDVSIGFADKHSPLIESFRTLRSNLQYFGVDTEIRTILVTSSLPREGKSTVSINLGLGLALSGARVIVLEADLRRPMLHTYLKLGNDVGLSNVLAGTHTFSEAMQLVRVDDYMPEDTRKRIPSGAEDLLLQKNFYCITSGPLPPNPSELMGSAKMQELLRTAAEAADYVIVDTPPLLLAADAVTLSAQVDGVLLTARLFSTTRDEAQATREVLERVGARVIGAVAFGGRLSQSYYRRGYGGYRANRYGYGRGYGYGYGVQEPAEASAKEK